MVRTTSYPAARTRYTDIVRPGRGDIVIVRRRPRSRVALTQVHVHDATGASHYETRWADENPWGATFDHCRTIAAFRSGRANGHRVAIAMRPPAIPAI